MSLDPLLFDPVLFARHKLNFHPEPRQTEMLRLASKRVILNCSRQCGKSTITAIIAIHRAHYYPKSLILVVSPSGRQSAEFVRKLEDFLPHLGLSLRGDGDNRISVLFPNGSRIVGLPANEDTCRGFSGVSLLIIDDLPLGTSYLQIIRHVRDLCQHPTFDERCTVVVDASGVGAPIVEMLRRDLLNCRLEPVTITSGRKTRHDHEGWLTPRRELIQTLALHLEQNRIRTTSRRNCET